MAFRAVETVQIVAGVSLLARRVQAIGDGGAGQVPAAKRARVGRLFSAQCLPPIQPLPRPAPPGTLGKGGGGVDWG